MIIHPDINMSCNSDDIVMNVPDKVGALKSLINSSGSTPVFVFFYSETCGHCQTLMKYFIEYRNQCSIQKAKAAIVFVNGKTSPELFTSYSIGPVPQVMVFKNKQRIKHIIGANVPDLACAFKAANIQLSKGMAEE